MEKYLIGDLKGYEKNNNDLNDSEWPNIILKLIIIIIICYGVYYFNYNRFS